MDPSEEALLICRKCEPPRERLVGMGPEAAAKLPGAGDLPVDDPRLRPSQACPWFRVPAVDDSSLPFCVLCSFPGGSLNSQGTGSTHRHAFGEGPGERLLPWYC